MKTVSIAVEAALLSKAVRYAFLAEIDTADGLTHFWSGVGTLSYNSYSWLGLGLLGRISGMGETAEIRVAETSYELSGVDPANPELAKFLEQPVRGYLAKCWLAFMDENWAVIPDPIQIDETILDTASTRDGEDGTTTLVLTGHSAIFDFRQRRARSISHEEHLKDYPASTGFSRMPTEVADKTVIWTNA